MAGFTRKWPSSQNALALITQGDSYVLQDRPNLPGRLAYSGRVHFFGGGVRIGEEKATDTVFRTLCEEETNAPFDVFSDPKFLWQGAYMGEGKHGEPTLRFIHLIGLTLDPDFELRPKEEEGGNVVKLPREIEAVNQLEEQGRLTPFALEALTSHLLNNGTVSIKEHPDTSYLQ